MYENNEQNWQTGHFWKACIRIWQHFASNSKTPSANGQVYQWLWHLYRLPTKTKTNYTIFSKHAQNLIIPPSKQGRSFHYRPILFSWHRECFDFSECWNCYRLLVIPIKIQRLIILIVIRFIASSFVPFCCVIHQFEETKKEDFRVFFQKYWFWVLILSKL